MEYWYERVIYTDAVHLYSSSLQWNENTWGIPLFNRLSNFTIHGKPIEEKKRVHVGTLYIIASYILKSNRYLPFGLKFNLYDENGQEIEDEEALKTRIRPGLTEVDLLARYLKKLGKI